MGSLNFLSGAPLLLESGPGVHCPRPHLRFQGSELWLEKAGGEAAGSSRLSGAHVAVGLSPHPPAASDRPESAGRLRAPPRLRAISGRSGRLR